MKQITKYILPVLCISLAFALFSCDEKKVLESSKEDKVTVKQIGDFEVPLEIYRYVALNYKADYEYGASSDIWLGESGSTLLNEINADIDETLLKMYTTLYVCDKYGIHPDDSFIVDSLEIKMENIYESYNYDYEMYNNEIAAHNMNDSVYRFITRNDILSEELLAKMIESGEIPGDTETIRKIIESDECVRVKQILISADNGKTDAENLKFAEELLEKLKNGEDFDSLVQKYGEDLYMFNNDDGYYVTRGNLHTDFETAAFSLAVEEISDIVKTDAGYSIIKRYDKEESYIDKNSDKLISDCISGLYNISLEKYSKNLTVEDTDNLARYSIFNLKK